jgi:hypothetical protein
MILHSCNFGPKIAASSENVTKHTHIFSTKNPGSFKLKDMLQAINFTTT